LQHNIILLFYAGADPGVKLEVLNVMQMLTHVWS